MLTVKVWALLMMTLQNQGTGAFVIDNIASEAECTRVGELMAGKGGEDFRAQKFRCVEVEKLLPVKE